MACCHLTCCLSNSMCRGCVHEHTQCQPAVSEKDVCRKPFDLMRQTQSSTVCPILSHLDTPLNIHLLQLSELNSIVGSNVAGLEAQFRCLASECNERVSALLQLDAQISALGPEGVNKLHREVREVGSGFCNRV
eukprot:scaffold120482_cov17-Tisochrysis_lutea.AAC.1